MYQVFELDKCTGIHVWFIMFCFLFPGQRNQVAVTARGVQKRLLQAGSGNVYSLPQCMLGNIFVKDLGTSYYPMISGGYIAMIW